jgi:hypothetical protein
MDFQVIARLGRRGTGAALCAAVASCGGSVGGETMKEASHGPAEHLRVDDTVGDMLQHPAFAGFSPLLLPWDDRRVDTTMRLRDTGSLLPYHTHVDPVVVVSSLNRIIDDAATDRTVFYDFYTAAEKEAEPARRSTGLFFFRGKPGAPFAVVAYVGSLHEGFPYAAEISKRGFNAFVLKYRTGRGGRVATEDLAAALSFIIRNAESLGSKQPATRCGAAPRVPGWRRTSAPTVPRPSAALPSRRRRRS